MKAKMLPLPPKMKAAYKKLLDAQNILKKAYPLYSFTLDGKLIGDIGEALIQKKLKSSKRLKEGSKCHDLLNGKTRVQVKTTQKNSVGMGLKKQEFEHLIAIKIYKNGKYEIVFDGPGSKVVNEYKGNSIKVDKLRNLNQHRNKKIIKSEK